tara:strand:+ start:637 stop:789 length:153 start_codon:yes stop_codon:yes gene_type:complete
MLLGSILVSFVLALVLTLVLCNRLMNRKDMARKEELKNLLNEYKKYKRYE